MVVRLRVRIRSSSGELITSALANSGYEAEEPEVVLPVSVAERLGLYPSLPGGTEVEEYVGVGGSIVRAFRTRGAVELTVLADDRMGGPVRATAVITPGEDEVILSDKALDALGVVLLRPGAGIWRFSDDPPGIERASERREHW
mgnify:CR=1 FL=1